MKHIPARKFEKVYVWSVLIPIMGFIVFMILALIFTIESLHIPSIVSWILGVLSVMLLLTSWVIIITYRGRMKGLYQEIFNEDFKLYTDGKTPYSIQWVIMDKMTVIQSGHEITFHSSGIHVGDREIDWTSCLSFETTLHDDGWKASLSYHDQGRILTFAFWMDHLGIKIIEHFSKRNINDDTLKQAEEEQLSYMQSEIVWGTNLTLWIQRIGFIAMITITGIGGGTLLGLYVMSMELSILLANLFIIPILLVVYPKRYKDYPSSRYLLNKKVIGYAKGRQAMLVSFESIESMSYDEKRLYLNLFERDQEGDPVIVYIPRDHYLIDRLKEHMERYHIQITLIKL